MNHHQSPLALPAFNPCANSNDSDRSSSSNTTVTANAFSSPNCKRPDLSTVFANVAPDAPPRHAISNGTLHGLKSNAFTGNGLSQFDAANGRLDASCWVQNGLSVSNGMNLNPSTQSLSSSNRSTPPQFLDDYGISGGGGGSGSGNGGSGGGGGGGNAAVTHSNMTSFPSFLHHQRPQYQSTTNDSRTHLQPQRQRQGVEEMTPQRPSYRLINAFQDLTPCHQRQSEQNQQFHQLTVGITGNGVDANYGHYGLNAVNNAAVSNGVNLQSMQSALGAVSRFGAVSTTVHGLNGLNLCSNGVVNPVATESIPPNVGRVTFGMEALDRNQSALPSTTRSLSSFQNGIPRSISNSNLNGNGINGRNGRNGINALSLNPQRTNSSLTASAANHSHGNSSRGTAAVVLTAPPLPAAALPAALKRSPSPHDSQSGKGVVVVNGNGNALTMKTRKNGNGNGCGNGKGVGVAMQKFECVDCGKRYKHLSNLRAHAKCIPLKRRCVRFARSGLDARPIMKST